MSVAYGTRLHMDPREELERLKKLHQEKFSELTRLLDIPSPPASVLARIDILNQTIDSIDKAIDSASVALHKSR